MPRANGAMSGELFEVAPCGLLSTSADGTIDLVNQTFCRWLGFTADELVGKKRLQDLLAIGSRIYHETHWYPLLEMQGAVAEVHLELLHRDGYVLPMLVNASLQRREGGVHHDVALFLARDRRKYEQELLAARTRAESLLEEVHSAKETLTLTQARLRLALDSADLLVWDVDVETHVPSFESGVERLLGLDDGASVTWQDFRAQIRLEDRAAEAAAFASALDPEGDGSYFAEYRLEGRDGLERVINARGRAFFGAAGQLVGFSGILQDFTQWRRAENVLRDQEQQAKSRAALAEQLVAIVSHDLRSPLHAALLAANWLATGELSTLQARAVEQISASVGRANRLIADLLDFTEVRLGTGIRVTLRSIDLHALVNDVLDELRLGWPDRQLEHLRYGTGMGLADADRLAQAITNIAVNALSYGAAERPVTVTSTVNEQLLTVSVHNEGAPIPTELMPYIFEPLRRGERDAALGTRSVGLGLYIVQEISTAHGGTITVQSTAAAGTTFLLTIPRFGKV